MVTGEYLEKCFSVGGKSADGGTVGALIGVAGRSLRIRGDVHGQGSSAATF